MGESNCVGLRVSRADVGRAEGLDLNVDSHEFSMLVICLACCLIPFLLIHALVVQKGN